jgi:hypothetical protein
VHLEDKGIEEKVILKWKFEEIRWESVDWIYLAHKTNK